MIEVTAYKCDCGKKYHTKSAAKRHELNCKCWTNPKFKTCKSCKFCRVYEDSNGMEHQPQFLHTWKQIECTNPLFDYDKHFTAAHFKAQDLNINCPVWANK